MKDIEDATSIERVQHYIDHLHHRCTFSRWLIAGTDDEALNELEKVRLANMEDIIGHLQDAVDCNRPRYCYSRITIPEP